VEKEQAAGSAFGTLLRRHRVAAGLSQEVLAERARMSTNGISALERGDRRYPYRETVTLLATALGLSPAAAAEFQAAAARPRQPQERTDVEPSRPTVPPLRSVDAIPNNLPRKLTSFIGREAEIAEITTLLGSHQLVTIVGSGGVGKTRTSLAVAEGVFGAFADGVWLIELAPLSRGDYIPGSVAQALGLTLPADGDLVANLARTLKSKHLLLIFDNCEHLVADVAKVVSLVLNDCHKVKILATSREPLRVRGEATYRMPSLPVPPAAGSVPLSVAVTMPNGAVALFGDRARAVDHLFTLTDENAPFVADICRRLDGIPLAIELAAARMTMLSPQQLRDRLSERFRILTGGGRDRLPRHQTLRALIDWSHDLLEEREQRLLRRLGIFANGFTLEAASAVCGCDERDEFEVFDLLASLVEKSLVIADCKGDSVRYRLLESTRVYAAEKLALAGEGDALASRHLRYFRDWFVELRRERDQLRDRLETALTAEFDDLRVALDGALVRRELTEGAELVAAIGIYWVKFAREGIARCEAFMAELPRSKTGLLGELGASLTFILYHTGEHARSREAGVAAIGYARASGDGRILAFALDSYAWLLQLSRDFAATDSVLTEAEAIQEGVPPLRRLLLADRRAALSMMTGDLDSAALIYARLREEWRAVGFGRHEARATTQLSAIEFCRRQYQRAVDLAREAVSVARNHNMTEYPPYILVCLGQVLALTGAIDTAISPAIEATTLWACRDPGHGSVTTAIELLAYVAAVQGDRNRAARLAGYADSSLARIGYSRDDMERTLHRRLMTLLLEHLEPNELARTMAEGASFTAEAAIALARMLETSAGTGATLRRSSNASHVRQDD
jgi:predicted ATPase/transcriptional regulator with XRE-family HTH domain